MRARPRPTPALRRRSSPYERRHGAPKSIERRAIAPMHVDRLLARQSRYEHEVAEHDDREAGRRRERGDAESQKEIAEIERVADVPERPRHDQPVVLHVGREDDPAVEIRRPRCPQQPCDRTAGDGAEQQRRRVADRLVTPAVERNVSDDEAEAVDDPEERSAPPVPPGRGPISLPLRAASPGAGSNTYRGRPAGSRRRSRSPRAVCASPRSSNPRA